jgi:ATP-dependent Clp protease ATP-binding subunit ClpA
LSWSTCIWLAVGFYVGVGASAALCCAAWDYYHRNTSLRTYGRDMTASARQMDPVIGRDDEIDRLVCILCRRTKNCAALVGASGVGKTAIAEGLAQRIAAGTVPAALAGARVVEVDLGAMVAGTQFRGMFEKRMKSVIKAAEDADGKVILFFDEMHTLLDAGSSRVSDSGNMLKPALARGRIRCVGATTYEEYQKYVEKDPAMERRFQKVHVEEPSEQATLAILQGLKPRYQEHHGSEIQDDALVAAAHLAARYVTDRQFPDKAIDLIDEACSTKKLQAGGEQEEKKSTIGPEDVARVSMRFIL